MKKISALVVFLFFAAIQTNAERFSIQADAVSAGLTLASPFLDNDAKTFFLKARGQAQHALNGHCALSLDMTFFFENMLASYSQDENGRSNEIYARYTFFLARPAFLFFPCGKSLRGFI